ncbi:hypothetical protein K470DRAFT_254169 [Piedraia hortae CBS 480.64]|uniref:Uncharacterized protein n=1 Tax=Piedraia hortae CBS 480.64 TaxID=1314780 RepID=A0A6A7CDW5_9PEZI|nr:hypothetical protein K470DRAFT_254169 [Piedraia hortae CBS 480.64]
MFLALLAPLALAAPINDLDIYLEPVNEKVIPNPANKLCATWTISQSNTTYAAPKCTSWVPGNGVDPIPGEWVVFETEACGIFCDEWTVASACEKDYATCYIKPSCVYGRWDGGINETGAEPAGLVKRVASMLGLGKRTENTTPAKKNEDEDSDEDSDDEGSDDEDEHKKVKRHEAEKVGEDCDENKHDPDSDSDSDSDDSDSDDEEEASPSASSSVVPSASSPARF